jgi:hypothetical protein
MKIGAILGSFFIKRERQMTTWIAIYRGASVSTAKVIAVTSEPSLVKTVAERLLCHEPPALDPVLQASEDGKRKALRLIAKDTLSKEVNTTNRNHFENEAD